MIELNNTETINSPFLEFSPIPYLNGIVFVSSRVKNAWKDPSIKENFFQLYYAEEIQEGKLLPSLPFSATINSHLHEGPAAFAQKAKTMFFTRNNLKKGARKSDKDGVIRLKIYETQKGLFDWENPKELPFNDDQYSSAHPTVNEQGNILFFSSDRPGGMGGMDLYLCKKTKNGWSQPLNLGPSVNTAGNELFPSFSDKGILFFSSDGHPGAGGLDLYAIKLSDTSKVFHLSSYFNSTEDDFGLCLMPPGNRGYFSSNRNGGFGKDDIYAFHLDETNLPLQFVNLKNIQFQLLNATNLSPIDDVELFTFLEHHDGFKGKNGNLYANRLVPSERNTNDLEFKLVRKNNPDFDSPDFTSNTQGIIDATLRTRISYLLLFSKKGYESREIMFSIPDLLSDTIIQVQLVPIQCKAFTLKILDGQAKKPIPTAIGSFESLCPDNPNNIIMESDKNGAIHICLPPDCAYLVKVNMPGFKSAEIQIGTSPDHASSSNVYLWPEESILAGTGQLKEGLVIVLNNIYYDFNKSAIRKGAARELDELASIMNTYPDMEVELISHTDARGSRKYNQYLSEKRSISAKEYLIAKGIQAYRMKASGKGETQIRNRCTEGINCSEDEHQYNRRTEVKVTKINAPVNIEYKN